ncbi:uncharacterized protein At5g01610-like [Abrus precatorius]|uniref:Uncharacterized protein At5g01610-like n=1 Tax=Abrus precatorius TaxID=3816 RepID=A0A8B8LAA6_ABRPR|nr:uncharacterized protein At5g01610-like [Abrus precatorius]
MQQTKGMRSSIIFLCIVVCVNVTAARTLSRQEPLSVYDVLEMYDFPAGLLPQGATGYELDEKNGHFTVHFDKQCIFSVQSYDLKYKTTIKGVISKGKLSKLKGISVKIELLWLNIVEVTREDDELQFSVGVASAAFSVDSFSESPQCGCGFDCYNSNKIGYLSSL